MNQNNEINRVVNDLDMMEEALSVSHGGVARHVIPAPQQPIQISVSVKEWSDLNRRNGFLEGVMASLMNTDAECWIDKQWEYYQHVMLGLPVVVEKEP